MDANIIDLGPIIEVIITYLAAALSALGTVGIAFMQREFKKRGIDISAEHRKSLENAIQRGISYATEAAKSATADFGRIETRNQVIATAANYATSFVPDAIKYFGVTPTALQDMIVSRLSDSTNSFPSDVPLVPLQPAA